MPKILSIPAGQVFELVRGLFESAGVAPDSAAGWAGVLVENEQEGYSSHGIIRVQGYLNDIKLGIVTADARPLVHNISALYTLVEGNKAVSIEVLTALRNLAGTISHDALPVHFVAVKNAHHLGRLATIARLFCEEGYLVHGFENYNGLGQKVMPEGAGRGRLATNPIVYGIPLAGGDPLVFDMTTSVVSEGKVRQHYLQKKPAAEGWLVDAKGNPVTDPALFYADPMQAFLAPLGGTAMHKGFGLGLVSEILASAFSGAGNVASPHPAEGNSAFFILYKVNIFGLGSNEVTERIKGICDYLTQGNESLHIPGTRKTKDKQTIDVVEAVWNGLLNLEMP